MLDIPLGKALVAVESNEMADCYKYCVIGEWCLRYIGMNRQLNCSKEHRKDGKNVIFKFVDYPVKE